MLGNDRVFAADLRALRPHRGQGDSAANIARMLKDSGLIEAGRPAPPCVRAGRLLAALHPAGARRRPRHRGIRGLRGGRGTLPPPSITRASRWTAVWSPTATSIGAPLAYVLDFLAIPTADVASISERRTDRFL